jgi:tyrosyl-tRNA synthetase
VVDALVRTGLAQSKAEARRGVEQRGFSINGSAVVEVDRRLAAGDLLAGSHVLLQKGRKAFALLIAEG